MLKLFRRVKKKKEKYQERRAEQAKLVLIRQLFQAVRACDEVGVVRALEAGADINWLNPEECSDPALFFAETRDMLQFLLDHGADPNLGGPFGRAPLGHYCLDGRPDLVACLMEAGADVNYYCERNNQDALNLTYYCRLKENRDEILEMLIAAGADPISYDSHGEPLMYKAAEHNDLKTMKLLFHRAGASVNTTRKRDDSTPLHVATYYSRIEAMEWLLESGAVVDALDGDNMTPLALAIRCDPEHTEATRSVKILLLHGANPNMIVHERHMPLLEYTFMAFSAYYIRRAPRVVTPLLAAGATMDMDRINIDAGLEWVLQLAPDLHALVEKHVTGPRSLKLTAACAVRAGLRKGAGGRSILQRALALPLPPALIRFVALSELESLQDSLVKCEAGSDELL